MSDLLAIDQESITMKAKLFRGFADPSRLSIIEMLRDGPKTVGELVELTELSQPNVSNHLRCLSDCDLVKSERNGRYIVYRLSDERIDVILEKAETLLAEVAKGVYECTRYEK
ncbi:MAG TPA: metalloregulator ArsR/SmtB family transcription factor [Balneolaceae bacterium]|nr:metalloregulator ArsR/SmtB family transcription factor [Balneolaceae bacterium]